MTIEEAFAYGVPNITSGLFMTVKDLPPKKTVSINDTRFHKAIAAYNHRKQALALRLMKPAHCGVTIVTEQMNLVTDVVGKLHSLQVSAYGLAFMQDTRLPVYMRYNSNTREIIAMRETPGDFLFEFELARPLPLLLASHQPQEDTLTFDKMYGALHAGTQQRH